MLGQSGLWRRAMAFALALALALPAAPVLARDWDDRRGHDSRQHGKHWDSGHRGKHWRGDRHHGKHWGGGDRHHGKHWRGDGHHDRRSLHRHKPPRHYRHHHHYRQRHHFRPPVVIHPRPRYRHYGPPAIIIRPYGRPYRGYGHYHGGEAFKWLAFTAITLGVLDYLSESERRAHEQAQVYATTAPVGRPIVWREGGAYGQVVTVRDGESTDGRYCREYQQTVTVGDRREQAYGTACLQPDGAWQMVRMTN